MDGTSDFRSRVYGLVGQIPDGRVMTYGDIAVRAGSPRSSRIVGTIAHYGPQKLPWHRVVNRFGGLASGFHGGREAQRSMLEAEGIKVNQEFIIDNFSEVRWAPLR